MKNIKKLEIGPGTTSLGSDWHSMDMISRPHVNIQHDIRNLPLPILSESYDLVYMSHILEHIPWFQTVEVLIEIKRILKKNGRIEIWVPDLKKLVEAYLNPALVENDGWYRYNPEKHPTKWFNGRLFTYGPEEENWHRAAFDAEFLKYNLQEAGFKNISLLNKPRGYDHGWINLGMSASK